MKYLILLIVLLLGVNANAQMWFSDGATWHYSYNNFFIEGSIKLSVNGDTLINGVDSKQIRKSKTYFNYQSNVFTEDQFDGFEYMYSDSDHVYQLINDEFVVLYDFNSNVGDTVTLYLDDSYFGLPECDSIGYALVTEVGTETINGENLRYYNLTTIEGSSVFLEGKIIEKIGNIGWYFFCEPYCFFIEESKGPFRCYQDNSFGLYSNPGFTDSCDFTIGINENNSQNIGIVIYPNPSSNSLQISLKKTLTSPFSIGVYSLNGKQLFYKEGLLDNTTLNVSQIDPGMYLLKVEYESGEKITKTFVKK